MDDLIELLESDPTKGDFSDKDISDDDLIKIVDYLEEKWTRPLDDFAPLVAAKRFNVMDLYTSNELYIDGPNGLDMRKVGHLFGLTRVEIQLALRNIIDISDTRQDIAGEDIKKKIRRVGMAIHQLHRVLHDDILCRKYLDPTWATECPNVRDELNTFDESKFNEFQTLLFFILGKLMKEGLCRHHSDCYEQIMSPAIPNEAGTLIRYNTHAWQRKCTLSEFITSTVTMDMYFDKWLIMTKNPSCIDNLVKYLSVCKEKQFPELVPNRYWHAFQNGLYYTKEGRFYAYGSKEIPTHIVACKYHDVLFDTAITEIENWYDVPTPAVQQILEYQLEHLGERQMTEIIMWVYAFMGRLLFEIGERDGWQVIFFCMGRAGTGKSRLIDACTSFFMSEDVAILANNSQKDFGLETFVDKLVWACYEVKHDLTLDQANFQSMVTGEKVSIARKHKDAQVVVWKIPGILAGNEPGGWTDNSGSISRRIVLLNFSKKVQSDKLDPQLDKKIKAQTANLLHKCCHAYLTATDAYGTSDIWKEVINEEGQKESILPRYFHVQKERMVELTHPIASFLRNCDAVVLSTESYMPWTNLVHLANEYFQNNNYSKFNWGKKDKFTAVLEDFGVTIIKLDQRKIKEVKGGYVYNGKQLEQGSEIAMGITEREFFTPIAKE